MGRIADNVPNPAAASSDRHRDLIAAARRQYEHARLGAGPHDATHGAQLASRAAHALPTDFAPGYELGDPIHRGGQGVVYRAVQKSTGRGVAIKIMLAGPLAGEHERLRFEREVRVLAQLEHPNIVGIVDSGIASGHAYFVMDFIDGQPLDAYLDMGARRHSELVRLFIRICAAVNAAHLRGVIHRDLKPSNIRVDAAGQPHILDFGLAKLVAPTPQDGSSDVTMTGQFVGSLPWASPEQAAGHPDQVDIRSDVYSLGVMLYQLLTGEFPYAVTGGLPEVLGRIEKAAPQRPRALNRRIDAELETIVLKCLAKEPNRRYQSAGELARDLEHYLAGEPLEAKRDSSLYVLRKTLGRHKLATVAGLVFVAFACASAIAMTILYRGQVRERDRAVAARDAARREADKARAIDEFLQSMLAAPDPVEAGRDVKVADVLNRAAQTLDGAFPNQPEVEAALRVTLGRTYSSLGLYPQAVEQLKAAAHLRRETLGSAAGETLEAMSDLASVLWMQGDLSQAEVLMRTVLDARRRAFGSDDPATLEALDGLGAILKSRGQNDEAIAIGREVLAAFERRLGTDDFATVQAAANLAFRLDGHGDHGEAEPLYRQALDGLRRLGHGDEPDTITVVANLANLLCTTGKLDEAEALAGDALEARQRLLPPGHPLIGDALQLEGRIAMARGDYPRAEELFRGAVAIHRASLPPDSWRTAITLRDLGTCLTRLARFDDAETQLLAAHAVFGTTSAGQLPQKTAVADALVALYEAWGRPDEAARWRAAPATSDPADAVTTR